MKRIFPWRTALAWIGAVLLGAGAAIVSMLTMLRKGDGIMVKATGILAGAETAQAKAEYAKAKQLDGVSDTDLIDELGNSASVRAVIDEGRERVRRVLDASGPGGRSPDESRRAIAGLRGEIRDVRGAIAAARAHHRGDSGGGSGAGGEAADG